MYECLIGYAPFCSDRPVDTYRKVIAWQVSKVLSLSVALYLLQGLPWVSCWNADHATGLRPDTQASLRHEGQTRTRIKRWYQATQLLQRRWLANDKVRHALLDFFAYKIYRDRPAALRIDVRGLTDTTNFDEFPPVDVGIDHQNVDSSVSSDRDWVFLNYTYKRFEVLTQRGKKRPWECPSRFSIYSTYLRQLT